MAVDRTNLAPFHHYSLVRIFHNADGANAGETSDANPFPITGDVGAALRIDILLNNTTELTIKYAIIAASSLGNNTLVAAVPGKRIKVIAYHFVCAAVVTARFESGADGTALSGRQEYAANSGGSPGKNEYGWFETAVGELLNLELSDAIVVSGHLTYVEI